MRLSHLDVSLNLYWCRNLAAKFAAIHEQPFILPHIVEPVTSEVFLRRPKISSSTCTAFQPSLIHMAERCHHHRRRRQGCPAISETSAPLPVMSHSNYIFTVHIHRLAVKFNAADHKSRTANFPFSLPLHINLSPLNSIWLTDSGPICCVLRILKVLPPTEK